MSSCQSCSGRLFYSLSTPRWAVLSSLDWVMSYWGHFTAHISKFSQKGTLVILKSCIQMSQSWTFLAKANRLTGWCLSGDRSEIIKTVLCCIVYWNCAVIGTLRWAVLTVLWIEFVSLGPFHCVYVHFVFFCQLHMCYIIITRWDGPDGIEA